MLVRTHRRSFLVGLAAATALSRARAAGPSAAERMDAANKHLVRNTIHKEVGALIAETF